MLIIMINIKENKFIALSLLTDESFPYFQNETFYDYCIALRIKLRRCTKSTLKYCVTIHLHSNNYSMCSFFRRRRKIELQTGKDNDLLISKRNNR